MGFSINSITSSKIFQKAAKNANKVSSVIGNALEKSPHKDTFDKVINAVDPTGANNAFIPMTLIMLLFVILERVKTAMTRNPEKKEETKDEIFEILRRDVQTVAIILFALKAINSMVAGKATKMSGLSMTNKPYQKLFNTNKKGLEGLLKKAEEIKNEPGDKLKKIGKNILDTLHPTGGVMALTNDQIQSKYSNFKSLDEIVKLLEELPQSGGDSNKVYNKILNSLINEQEELLNGNVKKGIKGLLQKAKQISSKNGAVPKPTQEEINNAQKILDELNNLKGSNFKALKDEDISKATKDIIISFFEDENNSLVTDAKGLNAILRTGALTFEALYLGLGLPAINQRYLEKKYLKNGNAPIQNSSPLTKNTASAALINRNLKAQEVKPFEKFIK